MSYKILFKGQVGDEFVEESRGRSLAEAWEQGRLTGKVRINENIYDAGSIKAIISGFQNPDKTDRNEETKKMIRNMYNEHQDATNKKLRQSPEIRSKNTGMADILHTTLTGHAMPDELKEKVIAAQLAFFKENPDYAEARPSCYKHLMPRANEAMPYHIRNAVVDAGFNLVERSVSAGIK